MKLLSQMRLVLAFAAGAAATGCGATVESTPVFGKTGEEKHDLDLGRVDVHAGMLRELPLKKRIDLSELLNPTKVFEEIKQSRRGNTRYVESSQTQLGLGISGLIPTTVTETLKSGISGSSASEANTGAAASSGRTPEGGSGSIESTTDSTTKESSDSEESRETVTTSERAPLPGGLAGRLGPVPAAVGGLQAPFHQVLYATADAILGGRALESLYNVEVVPAGYSLYSMPIVVSFQPGRVTRRGYIAEANIQLGEAQGAVDNITVLAVAPAGFTNFENSAASFAESLGASVAAAVPYGGVVVSGQVQTLLETLRQFEEVAKRPEFQVAIKSRRSVTIRYLGFQSPNEDGEVETTMQPATFNAEILMVAKVVPGGTPDCLDPGPEAANEKKSDADKTGEMTTFIFGGDEQVPKLKRSSTKAACPQWRDGVLDAELPYGGVWSFSPSSSLEDEAPRPKVAGNHWNLNDYGDEFEGIAVIYKPVLKPRIGRAFEAPGNRIIVEPASVAGAGCYCVEAFDSTSARATSLIPHGNASFCREASDAQVPQLIALSGPLEKGAMVVVSTGPAAPPSSAQTPTDPTAAAAAKAAAAKAANDACGPNRQRILLNVETLADRQPEKKAALEIKLAEAIMETDAIVVRLELHSPVLAAEPKVYVNGEEAVVRRSSKRTKEDQETREVFVKVAQKVDRKDAHVRTLRVEVVGKSAKGDELNASVPVAARW